MQSLNRKGFSQVVTILLIVILSIIAIGVLFFSVNNILNEVKQSPEFSCLDFKTSEVIRIIKTCYNESSGEMEVSLRRNLDENIKIDSLFFNFNGEKGSSRFSCGGVNCPCEILPIGGENKYLFNTEKFNEVSITTFGCLLDKENVGIC